MRGQGRADEIELAFRSLASLHRLRSETIIAPRLAPAGAGVFLRFGLNFQVGKRAPVPIEDISSKIWMRSIYAVCFGLIASYVSLVLASRFAHGPETIQNQLRIFAGIPTRFDDQPLYFGAWQNRVIVPAILRLAEMADLRLGPIYIAIRIVSAAVCLYVFALALNARHKVTWRLEVIGMGALTFMLMTTFVEAWENPTDFLDALFIAAFIYLSFRFRRASITALAIFASANRESSAFAGIIWIAICGFDNARPKWKEIAFGGALFGTAYLAAMGLKLAFGGWSAVLSPQSFTGFYSLIQRIQEFIAKPVIFGWPTMLVVGLGPILIWIFMNRSAFQASEKRLLFVAALLAAGTLNFGLINELRVFIPSFVIVLYVALILEHRFHLSNGRPFPGATESRMSPITETDRDPKLVQRRRPDAAIDGKGT